MGIVHLHVQVILHKVPELHLFLRLGRGVFGGGSQRGFLGPFPEHRRAIEVAVVAEGSIRQEPLLVLFKEQLVALAAAHGAPLLLEQLSRRTRVHSLSEAGRSAPVAAARSGF